MKLTFREFKALSNLDKEIYLAHRNVIVKKRELKEAKLAYVMLRVNKKKV